MDGWDDPRMPTISGMRRRGYSSDAIRAFCKRIGVSKTNSTVDLALLEFSVREDLNSRAKRFMGVVDPIKLTIRNWPEGNVEWFEAENSPEDPAAGVRKIPFSGELYVEREDFLEDPPRKWFRLAPGKEVRLKYAFYVTCEEVLRGDDGNVTELICSYDPESRGGDTPDGRKVKGTLHWVSRPHAVPAEIRLYETLFDREDPEDVPEGQDFIASLNPDSLSVRNGYLEPSLADIPVGEAVQFLRMGYFVKDSRYSGDEKIVFSRTVGLRDSWARVVRNKRENE